MLAKLQQRKGGRSGFTIIEVLIVLAIAGLIMLVVFLAVPALQRNARNTQRRHDVSALLGAYAEAIANNGGQIPTACESDDATCFVKQANLGYYPNTANTDVAFIRQATPTAPNPTASLDRVYIYNNAKCDPANPNNPTNVGATNRSVIVLFWVEITGGTGMQRQCQES